MEAHFTLTDAASIAGLEQKYFSRFFKEKTGIGFSLWLNVVRTHEAEKILSDSNVPITDVAAAVGYRDLRTFQRNFKKLIGVTPFQYRRRIRRSLEKGAARTTNRATRTTNIAARERSPNG